MVYVYHTKPKLHTSQTLSFHNNLAVPYQPPYFGYPHWESVTLWKYQHYPTLDTYLSLSFHSDTLPEYLPYRRNRRKNNPPYTEYLPHLPHPRHLSLHTYTHLTLPFITHPALYFATLYYCQGLFKYKAETSYQIRPKRTRAKMTQTKTTRECSCGRRTCTVVHLMIWLSIFVRVRIIWTSNIFVIIVFPYTHFTGTVNGTEPGDEFYTLPLIEMNIAAFQPYDIALFKTNFKLCFFFKLDNMK